MTQPSSPSAAALEVVENWKRRRRERVWPDCAAGSELARDRQLAIEIDAFAAQAVAAERAKPTASDLESVTRGICKASGLCKYVGDKCNTSRCSVSPDAVATALAERGERERERAAQIAEHIQELEDVALGIPAAIRNQTLTGD